MVGIWGGHDGKRFGLYPSLFSQFEKIGFSASFKAGRMRSLSCSRKPSVPVCCGGVLAERTFHVCFELACMGTEALQPWQQCRVTTVLFPCYLLPWVLPTILPAVFPCHDLNASDILNESSTTNSNSESVLPLSCIFLSCLSQ